MTDCILGTRTLPMDDAWDVIVAGGGPSGCAAATAAAREGARTLLIEATGALGGMGTMGLVPWFCGYSDRKQIIARGLAERIYDACREGTPHAKKQLAANPLASLAIDPELLKRVYDKMVLSAGVKVLFQTQVCAVEKDTENTVGALIVANKRGLSAYRAGMYVDCTGDGDLAAWAGASVEKGDAAGKMQPATHCFMITNVDDYGLSNGPRIHYYDPASPMHKALQDDAFPLIVELHSCSMQVGPGAYGFNTGHVFDVDNTDPESVSAALMQGRQMAAQYRDAFAKYHPAFANAFLAATGGLLGARETRRIMGDYRLVVEDYLAARSFPDEICRNSYGIDIHWSKEQTLAFTRKSIEELKQINTQLARPLKPGESVGVPYRCLTPHGLHNVLVAGRCISTDRQTNGSIRIMACCLTTGEAAGLAAAMAAAGGRNTHKVDTERLRQKLKAYGAFLPDAPASGKA
ncbi:MAG: FAD-dependent oxidoreductase [Kiritimatiellae bacterium]|nr:FAD-dependent oxidoreductase [Kiritimatiellia bacterium]